MQEHSLNKELFSDLVQYRKTMKIIMEKRWRGSVIWLPLQMNYQNIYFSKASSEKYLPVQNSLLRFNTDPL